MLAYDPAADAETNAAAMEETAAAVATGAVTVASRDVSVDGMQVERGAYLGLADGEPVAGGTSFDTVADSVVERLLGEPRDVLTFITGEDEPELGPLLARVAERHPERRARGSSRRPAALPAADRGRVAASRVGGCPSPSASPWSRTTRSFAKRSSCFSGCARTSTSSRSAEDGTKVVEMCREFAPDVVVMDYRLPALDGVQATRELREACPDVAVVCLTASANLREIDALFAAGAVACLTKDEPLDEIVAAIQKAAGTDRVMQLTAENTAIVLDSTADFPEAPERFPNWRIVPLYVRFGAESYRDYVDIGPADFYARLRSAEELPTTSQPTPADFLAAYEELGGYERVLSLHLSAKLSGTFASASSAAADRRPRARDRHRHGFGGDHDARAGDPATARAEDDRRGGGRARRPVQARVRAHLHPRHARVPGEGRADRPRRRLGRASSCTSSRSSRSPTARCCRSSACAGTGRRSRSS